MLITKISEFSKLKHTLDLDITEEQMINFKKGMKVQKAFPNLDADEREFLLTGITTEEWEIMSGKMESEENFDH